MGFSAKTRVIFDRKNVSTAKKKAAVVIEVYFKRERKYFSTGVELYKDQWKNGLVVRRTDSIELNERIKLIKAKIDDYIYDRIKNEEEIDLNLLRVWVESRSEGNSASFLAFMQQRILERPMSLGTLRGHQSVLNTLRKWGKIVTFSDLNEMNITLWDELSKRNSKNGKSITNYHKVLRQYIKDAIRFGHISENPYANFVQKYDRAIKHDFLTKEELERWKALVTTDKNMEKAKDMFIFCCYTGLAYSDLRNFNSLLITDKDGKQRYRSPRQKTGEVFNITLLKPAQEILTKYEGVPYMDSHVYNRYLKDIACLCQIPKKLSSHCGRTTFASTVMISNNVPMSVIQKAMGHANILQTQEYAKIVQSDVDREFDRLDNLIL